MRASRLNLLAHLVVALLAALALCAIAATAAQAATEGPFWIVEGKKLNASETVEMTVKAVGSITLEGEILGIKAKIICPKASVSKGSYIAGGVPGTGREITEIGGGCTVTNNGSGCKVEEPIRTEPIKNELVVGDSEPGFGPYVQVVSKSESGTKLVTLKFTGSSCIIKETEVTGEVLSGIDTYGPADSGKEEQVTTGNQETLSFRTYLRRTLIPQIRSFWEWRANQWILGMRAVLDAFGNPVNLILETLETTFNGRSYGTAF
jgi:hypothetical protein